MLDLESAIRFHTEEAEKMKLHRKVNEIILGTDTYERELKEHTQTAEWLKELAERRKQPIIRCKDCKHANIYPLGIGRAVSCSCKCGLKDAFVSSYCSYAERRTDG